MYDDPMLSPTDKWSRLPLGYIPVTRFNVQIDFLDFLAARTVDAMNESDRLVPIAQGSWHFNGSGSVANQIWTPFSWAETGGDASMSAPTLPLITDVTLANDALASQTYSNY